VGYGVERPQGAESRKSAKCRLGVNVFCNMLLDKAACAAEKNKKKLMIGV
jgi:hypothetical protein